MARIDTKHLGKSETISAFNNIYSHSKFSIIDKGLNSLEWSQKKFPEIHFEIYEDFGLDLIVNDNVKANYVVDFNSINFDRFRSSYMREEFNFSGTEFDREKEFDIWLGYGIDLTGKFISVKFGRHFRKMNSVDIQSDLIQRLIESTSLDDGVKLKIKNGTINLQYDNEKMLHIDKIEGGQEDYTKLYKKKKILVNHKKVDQKIKEIELYLHDDNDIICGAKEMKSLMKRRYESEWRINVTNKDDYAYIREKLNSSEWNDFILSGDVMEDSLDKEKILEHLDSANYFSRRIGVFEHPELGWIDVSLKFYGDKTSYGGETEGYIGPNEGKFTFYYEPTDWDRDKRKKKQEAFEKFINSLFETEEDVIQQDEI